MKALIDGDILRYEIGFAAEAGWKAITGRTEMPPWHYVEDLLEQRIATILHFTTATSYCLYLTEGRTFRFDIAKTKPYKGQRVENKPWHFKNISAYMKGCLSCEVITKVEADDAMAMVHTAANPGTTILCSRDKDLRTIPGLFYSWELGRQPALGPCFIQNPGTLELIEQSGKKVLKGTGYAFFCAQLLTGDRVDNIPGCADIGPVKAWDILKDCKTCEQYIETVSREYNDDKYLLEQGQLLWIVRRLNPDGTPELWRRALYV